MKHKVERRDGRWWVVNGQYEPVPYDTKQEAQDDCRGLNRFYERYADCEGGDQCTC